MERLNKLIAESGYTSRRKAEELIKNGKVFVNGVKVTELGTKASFNDEIMVDGNVLTYEEKEYYVFYKPREVISSVSDDKKRKTIIDFFDSDKRLFPVGRLDYDTTGVILVTNDGDFANIMMHPKNKIDKFYVAKIKGVLTKDEILSLKKGVKIGKRKIYPTRVKVKKIDKRNLTSIVEITVHDGLNHEIKELMLSQGHEVLKLKRECFGFITLLGLKSGEYRRLTPKEVKRLINLGTKKGS